MKLENELIKLLASSSDECQDAVITMIERYNRLTSGKKLDYLFNIMIAIITQLEGVKK